MPFLAPASMAMLHTHSRSSIERLATPGPVNSIDLYSAPSTPIRPMMERIRSLPDTRSGRLPVRTKRMAAGTLNQAMPVAIPAAISVEPTPVEKAPQRAVGAGVAVGADDAVAGGDDAFFGQQGVFNAHLAHVVEVEDVVLVCKGAALLGLGGALDVLVGHKVVQHDGHPLLVEYAVKAGLFKFVDGHRGW